MPTFRNKIWAFIDVYRKGATILEYFMCIYVQKCNYLFTWLDMIIVYPQVVKQLWTHVHTVVMVG